MARSCEGTKLSSVGLRFPLVGNEYRPRIAKDVLVFFEYDWLFPVHEKAQFGNDDLTLLIDFAVPQETSAVRASWA